MLIFSILVHTLKDLFGKADSWQQIFKMAEMWNGILLTFKKVCSWNWEKSQVVGKEF